VDRVEAGAARTPARRLGRGPLAGSPDAGGATPGRRSQALPIDAMPNAASRVTANTSPGRRPKPAIEPAAPTENGPQRAPRVRMEVGADKDEAAARSSQSLT
jgi:hypothetical protein